MSSALDSAATDPVANRRRVETILSQIEQLPTLPAVALRLLELTTAPDSCARDVVQVVETDQALTAKILSLVRRADLGVRGDVMTIDRVVVLLGFEAVRSAVLSVQIYEAFASVEAHAETDFDRGEFWKHGLAVACAAQLVAERLSTRSRAAEAFVCGLLHDVGKMALDVCLPKSYARVVRRARERHECISDVEQDILGLDHTVAGKRLLTQWKLPRPIVECAWLHHQSPDALPNSIEAGHMVRIVHLADNLARRQRIGFSGYNHVEPVDELARKLGLTEDALRDVTAKLPAAIQRHCQLVGLDRLATTDLYAEALADANEELGRLNRSFADANRRLELRSRYFDAMHAFSQDLTLDDRVADVCHAAAKRTAELLDVERAIAFATVEGEPTLHLGSAGLGEGCSQTALPLPVLEPAPEKSLAVGPPCLMPAADYSRHLVDRFDRIFAGERIWMLPFLHAGSIIGGVLFTAETEQVERHNHARTGVEALATAFGLAVASAAARREAHQLQEELAEVNRRLHNAQAELLRTRSLAMIAQMAAGAAHELNTPLAVISGRAQLLAQNAPDEPSRRALGIIREQCDRAAGIVTELMEFAKPDPPTPDDVPLASWAEEVRRRWLDRSSVRPEDLVVRISDPATVLRVDPHQLDRVVDALLANAMEASSGRNPHLQINSMSARTDDTVVVAVEDNGVGMSPDVLEHALDPFFSHRAAGRGRGLGLSRAARLVEMNGGRLWLESTPGVGTTAFVELPAARRT